MELCASAFVHVRAILQQQTVAADPLELELQAVVLETERVVCNFKH